MFIVLDAIDGAGKGLQRNLVVEELKRKGFEVDTQDFPDHKSPLYKQIIHPALHEERKLTTQQWFLSFALDQLLHSQRIEKMKGNNKFFVADGYFTTTLAFQVFLQKEVLVEQALQFAKDFQLPVPDLAVYIDVDPKIAMERKEKEEGHEEGLDIHERSLKKQEAVHAAFLKMVNEQIWCKWEKVNGEGTPDEVKELIMKEINKE